MLSWLRCGTTARPWVIRSGPLYKLLLLTGARKNEMAGARWSEIDLKKKLWTVPPERFKSNASHLVPLSDSAVAIIEALPRFTKGDHLFTTTYGEKPISGFSKGKARLDKLMVYIAMGCPRHPQDRSHPSGLACESPTSLLRW